MKAKELRNMDRAALKQQLATWQAEYFTARGNVRTGKEKNNSRVPVLRREIARVLTVLREQGKALP